VKKHPALLGEGREGMHALAPRSPRPYGRGKQSSWPLNCIAKKGFNQSI